MGSIAKLSFLWLLLNAASAWKVDPRCPDPVNRRLEEGADVEEDVGFDDFLPEDDFPVSAIPNFLTDMSSGALRGQHRDLKAGPDVFAVKMYWEAGFCWQEEYDLHREWCWECKGSGCSDGKGLWWQKCDSKDKKQQFSYIPSSTNGDGQFRWAHDNLCLQRVSGFRYEMKRCSTHPNQIIVGFNANSPFEMFPKGDRDKCINQHHHPKAGEIVENTRCKTARYWKTNLMELVSISETGNPPDDDNSRKIEDPNAVRLRKPQCTNNKKCERCEGDCDRDSHCQGNLICYQRRGLTKYVPVPGCGGDPRPDKDYCINPDILPPDLAKEQENNSVTSSGGGDGKSRPYQTPVRNCSPSNPCGQCEGDCDNDRQCRGSLKCFQKNGAADIPGCDGREKSKTDFCYDPNF